MGTRILRAAALALVVAGCTTVRGDAGFDDVRSAVRGRIGKDVAWSGDDAEVARAVDALLARPLTADAAVQVALLENRALRARYAELGIAQAELVQAGLLANPVLDAAVRWPAAGGRAEIDASLVTDFLRILFLPLRVKVASANVEAAKSEVAAAVLEHAGETRTAFVELQTAAQLVEMWEQVVRSTGGSYAAARALREAGNIPELDLGRERALHDRARLDLADAHLALADARERVTVLMGVWGERPAWTFETRLPDVPKETAELADLESRAVSASLDLARVRHRIEATALGLGLTETSRLFSGELNAGPTAEREEGGWEVGPSVSVPLPLFDQGQGRVAEAQARLRRELDAYYALAVEVRSAARAAAQSFLSARSKAVYLRDEVIPLQTRLVDEAQLQYNAMQIGVFELLQEKERQIQAGQRAVEALREYWLARADLQQLMDGKLPRRPVRRPPANAGPQESEREHER